MKMKKFLSMTMATTMLMCTSVFANDTTKDYYEYQGVKFDNSIKKSEAESIPLDVLETMQNSDGIIKSLSKEDIEFEDEIDNTNTMPTNHFYMYVWAEDLTEKNYEDYDKWQFNAQGNWVINPKYEFTDVIALSWSDDFTLKSSKCTIDNSSYRTSVNKIAAEEGVAYDVDLQLG